MAKYKSEVICDLAETYHILNYRELPPKLVATLVTGLGNDSRLKRKLAGVNASAELSILALIYDKLSLYIWAKSNDGRHNRNRPKSLYEALNPKPKETKVVAFESGEDFDKARQAIIEKYRRATCRQ